MSFKSSNKALENERAVFLAEEAVEILKNIRDKNFEDITNGTYGLVFGVDGWQLSNTEETIDIFTRAVTVSTIDQHKKKIEVLITWQDKDEGQKNYTLNSYLTNWRLFTPSSGLTLKKIIINRYSANTVANFAPYTAQITVGATTTEYTFDYTTATESPLGTYVFETLNLGPGTYTISENSNPAYTTTFADDCSGTGQVTLGANESKLCTIINEENIEIINLTVTKNSGNTNYIINGQNDPLLSFTAGKRYIFNINTPGQPFWIKTGRANKVIGTTNAYNTGVQNNGIDVGQIIFDVPTGAPVNDLYYISQNRTQMSGNIDVSP
jgi:hypothetical protein